jgi:hypothetical protein
MNHRFLAVAALLFLACGDKNPATTETSPSNDTVSTPQKYFPVMDFLKSQIAAVDSLPVGLMRYRTTSSLSDSGYIQREEFRKLAAEFVPAALNDSTFKKEFKETSFVDQSTGSATFFYSTANSAIDLKRVDVLTEKTDTYDKVKSIYLEKSWSKGDSLITKKLFWKPERSFQVITQVSKTSGDPETELIKVVWDNRE